MRHHALAALLLAVAGGILLLPAGPVGPAPDAGCEARDPCALDDGGTGRCSASGTCEPFDAPSS